MKDNFLADFTYDIVLVNGDKYHARPLIDTIDPGTHEMQFQVVGSNEIVKINLQEIESSVTVGQIY